MLSRFRSHKEQAEILKRLGEGRVDIVIGTHRLIQKDVQFKDLGLVIIDEEQRFGVTHKERLKQLRKEVDVLTLTATPIPRTLYMALTGVRDMSTIDTPPDERLPIKTRIAEYDENLIRAGDPARAEPRRPGLLRPQPGAGHRADRADTCASLVPGRERGRRPRPDARGRAGAGDARLRRRASSTCWSAPRSSRAAWTSPTPTRSSSTGPTASAWPSSTSCAAASAAAPCAPTPTCSTRRNTPLTDVAKRRLAAIAEASELGAGFQVAMHDLEIRGAGELLGRRQHGHIAAVGFDLYTRMLANAVERMKRTQPARKPSGRSRKRRRGARRPVERRAAPAAADRPMG